MNFGVTIRASDISFFCIGGDMELATD